MSTIPVGRKYNKRIFEIYNKKGKLLADKIKIASGFGSKFKGLLGKKILKNGEGLFIVKCTSIHMFFMSIPLDVIFIDYDGKIVEIYKNLKPWRISRIHLEALGVIEVPAGFSEKFKLKKGDKLKFKPQQTTQNMEFVS
jgi:uncharacterized protein